MGFGFAAREAGRMLTGDIRRQIDSIWDDFWSGGVSNPLSVIEQITYLLFIKRLDELQMLEEKRALILKRLPEKLTFPEGNDPEGRPYRDLRWSVFKSFEPREMFTVVDRHVFRSFNGWAPKDRHLPST